MNKKGVITIIICIVTAIIIGIYLYINLNNKPVKKSNVNNSSAWENNEISKNIKDSNTISTINIEDKVNPNATLVMTQFYKSCGHIVSEQFEVPKEIVNLNRQEVENYYVDWEVKEFSKNVIRIYKENNSRCNQHYVVKENNGSISIFSKNENNEEKLIENTNIQTKYLSEDDLARLKNGVNIVGKEDLSSFLEDFE